MSKPARDHALALPFSETEKELIEQALGEVRLGKNIKLENDRLTP
jgi:hypothetical protein